MHIGLTLLTLAIGLASLWQVQTDPRITAEFRQKSWIALAYYWVFVAAGIAVMALLSPEHGDDRSVLYVLGFFVPWITLAGLWLARIAPKTKNPPAWMMHAWGWLDFVLIAISLSFALLLIGIRIVERI